MNPARTDAAAEIWRLLERVPDPEIPVLSVVDLGVVREVRGSGDEWEVIITPTYSGCPATEVIEHDIRAALDHHGYSSAKLSTVLSPPWTSDWLSDAGKEKLRAFGIAPPETTSADKRTLFGERRRVHCPRCQSKDAECISEFGSTPCKAHYQCLVCLEPFDAFKCI